MATNEHARAKKPKKNGKKYSNTAYTITILYIKSINHHFRNSKINIDINDSAEELFA